MVKINSFFKRRQIHGSYWIQTVYWFVLILLFNGSFQSHLGNYSLSWLSSNLLAHHMAFYRKNSKAFPKCLKYVWCYISVCIGAVVLYRLRHKPVNSGFIARSARCTAQELKHTSLCHQPKRPHQGFPLLLSQFSHLIDSCSHTVSTMASLCEFFAFDKGGIVYNNIHVS